MFGYRGSPVRGGALLSTTALALIAFAGPAFAQPTTPEAPQAAAPGASTSSVGTAAPTRTGEAAAPGSVVNEVAAEGPSSDSNSLANPSDIVVTGSRIVRNGYSAPTPVTVVSTEQLQRTAPGAIPEGLNQLPQFAGSRSNASASGNVASPQVGNYLSLRNLGALRTLTLLDGQRLPPTSFEGTTDANIIPQALIQRVEVVTGGASAAYGSDAVSGVINFILDTKFNGIKGQAQAGITEYGDAQTYKFNLAGGFGLFDNRVHVLFSYDHYQQAGIEKNEDRPYGKLHFLRTGTGTAANPYIEYENVNYSGATYGTLISASNPASNPLRNYQFITGGLAVPFNPGTPTGTAGYNIGGDGVISFGKTLTATQNTEQAFGRVDVEISPTVQAFAQFSYANSFNSSVTIGTGTQVGDFQIFTENPFIAESTRTILRNAGVVSFIAGRIQADQPFKLGRFYNNAYIFVSGLKGKIADRFDWSLGYSRGDTKLTLHHEGNFDNGRYYAALDAVRGPNGDIVCRVTVTNPGLYPGCVPFNIFGNGSPSSAAYAYISQTSSYAVKQSMDIFTANVSGDLFNLPAGPVSLAVGGEYRRQDLTQTSNTDPSKGIDLTGLRTNTSPFILKYNSTNVGATASSQNVKEAYAEIAIPLLKGVTLIQALDLNAAVRFTDYSTSGSVKTWKVGASWVPIDSLRFRATRSRDIRAPTLNELFAAPNSGSGTFFDIHTNTTARLANTTTGNPLLKPELADTFTGGVVFSPTFFPRFQASVDYYRIEVKNAIGTIPVDDQVTQCEASNGTAAICSAFIRPLPFENRTAANFPSLRTSFPINQAKVTVAGLDYEISYRANLGFGIVSDAATLDMRLIGGHLFDYLSQTQTGGAIVQSANAGNNSKDRINGQLNFTDGPIGISTQMRWIGPRKKSQDPAAIYVKNDVPSVFYTDATASYKFTLRGVNVEAYLTVANLFDKDPPLYSTGGQPSQSYPTNVIIYDVFGRTYTGGVRVRF